MTDEGDAPGGFASPPCFAHEIAPDHFDPLAVDPQQASDVARWRRDARRRLRAERLAISAVERQEVAAALARTLDAIVAECLGSITDRVISGYWPIKGEPDLRGWLVTLGEADAITALPVVETRAAPLVFRRWTRETPMTRGDWNIPVPPPEAAAVTPTVMLAPLVGWDSSGYRLGYGGGYFDRTLAALRPRPVAIGVGLQAARLETIYPQPHDIPMDIIVTEDGVQVAREAPLMTERHHEEEVPGWP
jgi:5-formyltetrahydrofolate cyclo-ligase